MPFFTYLIYFLILLVNKRRQLLYLLSLNAPIEKDRQGPSEKSRDRQNDTQHDVRRRGRYRKCGTCQKRRTNQSNNKRIHSRTVRNRFFHSTDFIHARFKIALQPGQFHFIQNIPIPLQLQRDAPCRDAFRQIFILLPPKALIAVQIKRGCLLFYLYLLIFVGHIRLSVSIHYRCPSIPSVFAIGRNTRKVLPAPEMLSTSIFPPTSSKTRFTRASPNPLPSVAWEVSP